MITSLPACRPYELAALLCPRPGFDSSPPPQKVIVFEGKPKPRANCRLRAVQATPDATPVLALAQIGLDAL